MARLLIIAVVLILLYLAIRWFVRAKVEDARKMISAAIFVIILSVLIFLAVTGRLHWLFAVIGAAIPIVQRLWRAWRAYRMLKGAHERMKQGPQHPNAPGKISIAEAYQILGLQPGATKEQIIKAHRSMMRDAHPDRGGSDQQAQQLNAAKELLLKHLGEK